jgi:hypothetical protein
MGGVLAWHYIFKIQVMDEIIKALRQKSRPPLFSVVIGGYFDPGKRTFGVGIMVELNLEGLVKWVL